ncbi:chorismate synthase [Thermospira aquatica]|uniref:Chorismate synthase n=1 Tax=Thermospira aquatica TaxID=2828656 RepID=A0AAX3BCF5_9SPIR|nr:chorismate synthase [Thermospira aquatica]URA09691.1 chorismate synthase [Thermospira aquatica]
MIHITTSGESHGRAMLATITGIPSGLEIDLDFINHELKLRQSGFGRGGRMKIETDTADILTGVINGKTTGSPITIAVWNKDWDNWKDKKTEPILTPRPGHADLIGMYKYGHLDDARKVLERASARETAARVAAGALVKLFLRAFKIDMFSHIVNWGGITPSRQTENLTEIREISQNSPFRWLGTPSDDETLTKLIEQAMREGFTLGGIIETIIYPIPPMLGSYQTAEQKLDAQIAASVLSIQAIKGIEFGLGFAYANRPGKDAMDAIYYGERGYYRQTNYAGGIEGGMTNGNPVVFRSVMKPIPTQMSPLETVHVQTKEKALSVKERSDVTAVFAASIVIESAVAPVIANALMERYGSDHMERILEAFSRDPSLQELGYLLPTHRH